ncbi:DNA mismatch repair protein MutS [Anaerosolibacter carboniphilus]|uniref:DNA mismatch repair protein MutS n=1 Tax=Anaerosolibacter carboniphilus TaxID=1417629 RepID=A0A841KSX6_9FIRM|nr:DNA mismatch repair protein MutS [Anaerosolibacter carboniphilus]MBB6216696.1 DNA mismatch repair protein MutS [Anaerosolibacter carboniphilus]
MENLTPMMRQYLELKESYKDCILFFRLGDFYEMFFEDALTAARELEITLTGRDCGLAERAPMCGVPYHAADNYISKLIDKGYKVAIGEQVEDPAVAKGIVRRDVVRVITPGTLIDPHLLPEKENNYIMSIFLGKSGIGITFADISTGELRTTEFSGSKANSSLLDEVAKISPKEIIMNDTEYHGTSVETTIKSFLSINLYIFDTWAFENNFAEKKIKDHYHILSLDGLGLVDKPNSVAATGALLEYLQQTQKSTLNHMNHVKFYTSEQYMILDKFTRRNLELTETMRDKVKKGSLLWVLDRTSTAMGARILRRWVEEPLRDIQAIVTRLEVVDELKNNLLLREDLKELLNQVYDLERLAGRIAYGNANGRDLIALKLSLEVLPQIKNLLNSIHADGLKAILAQIDTLEDIYHLIHNAIVENPPLGIKEGGLIKDSYDPEIAVLREAITNGKTWITNLEHQERQSTGIKSLKISYNKVFGYYIEITKSNIGLAPKHYERKQTLANAERYIIPELKEIESKILGAEEKIVELEYQVFIQVRNEISQYTERIQTTASALAQLDGLLSFAEVSDKSGYVKPEISQDDRLEIINGRHPVVERSMAFGSFVANDTSLDTGKNRFAIITGPNMAGKSTYMRQVALIVLMAQIGCFVPADQATIGIVDRIFTRVGASDDLSQGQSTFMVEMSELANILNNATTKSLIILDEIGRGTSTYDGLSIAWAVVEYISNHENIGARTLFATHYHELTELEGIIEGVNNYCISVKEHGDDIIFLRKIIPGGADQSYGIQVAKLAGITDAVITRAKQILQELEANDINRSKLPQRVNKPSKKGREEQYQITMFSDSNEDILNELKSIDIVNITPMEAMNRLYKLVNMTKK